MNQRLLMALFVLIVMFSNHARQLLGLSCIRPVHQVLVLRQSLQYAYSVVIRVLIIWFLRLLFFIFYSLFRCLMVFVVVQYERIKELFKWIGLFSPMSASTW